MGTEVIFEPSLRQTVHRYDVFHAIPAGAAAQHFCAADLMVIDGIEWSGLEAIRRGLIPQWRPFKAPFHPPYIDSEVAAGMDAIVEQADKIFGALFHGQRREEFSSSLRPMITGPEPMHFDTYDAPITTATVFINVALTPRVYRVGPTFMDLVEKYPHEMKKFPDNASYRIRDLTVKDQLPLPRSAAAHTVKFAPGAMWIFNAKMVSHEVVYGEGAIGLSWVMPDLDTPSQESLLRLLKEAA